MGIFQMNDQQERERECVCVWQIDVTTSRDECINISLIAEDRTRWISLENH